MENNNKNIKECKIDKFGNLFLNIDGNHMEKKINNNISNCNNNFMDIFNTNCSGFVHEFNYFKKQINQFVESNSNELILQRTDIMKLDENLDLLINSIKDIYESSIRDSKTNLYNMGFFWQFLELEINNINRYKDEDIVLIVIDIDFFKKINDTYGHMVGDELILEIAKILKNSIRDSDVAVRFGGEEFIVLLTHAELKCVNIVIERIKSKILENVFLQKYNLKISGGVAKYKLNESVRDFLDRADRALYLAKTTGRDRFILDL